MLEKIVLDKEMTKEEYKARLPGLEWELFDLERRTKAAKIPTMIVFEGWEAAGKGSSIKVVTEQLDPRALRIHPIQDSQSHELARPWMWRFWMKTPNDGEIAIFDTSWYRHVLQERMSGKVKRREWEEAFHEINEFEHQLADDGTVMIKFWLHISKKEQRKRFDRAEKDPRAFFTVTKEMWKQNKSYEKWTKAVEEMLERTESEWAPWTIVESHDRRSARVKIFETIIKALSARLAQMPNAPPPLPRPASIDTAAKVLADATLSPMSHTLYSKDGGPVHGHAKKDGGAPAAPAAPTAPAPAAPAPAKAEAAPAKAPEAAKAVEPAKPLATAGAAGTSTKKEGR